jgi:hypothetical protein
MNRGKLSLRIVALILVAGLSAAAPFLLLPRLKRSSEIDRLAPKPSEFAGVLELWHIEGFEGGTSSAAAWLTARAVEFERKNPRAFVLVRTKSPAEAALSVAQGQCPHLVSFAPGTAGDLYPRAQVLPGTFTVRDDLLAAGRSAAGQVAVPYMMGGYVAIGHDERMKKAGVTAGEMREKLLSAAYTEKKGKQSRKVFSVAAGGVRLPFSSVYDTLIPQPQEVLWQPSGFDAYTAFMNRGDSVFLLGTQRDLARIATRISQNTAPALSYLYPTRYTDLVQYLAVTRTEGMDTALRFIHYLTEDCQPKVTACGMLSADGKAYASDPLLRGLETALSGPLHVLPAFLSGEELARRAAEARGAAA